FHRSASDHRLRALRVRLWGADRLAPRDGSPGTRRSDRLAERQCIRSRAWGRLGTDSAILARTDSPESRSGSPAAQPGRDSYAIRLRSAQSRGGRTGGVHARRGDDRPTWEHGHSVGPVARLREQRATLPSIPTLLPREAASVAGDLGQARSL